MAFELTRAANADLANIWDYTVDRWGVDQAAQYTLKIKFVCEALVTNDYPNQSAEDVRSGYRRALVGRHVLFFISREDHILIVRILHQSMDVAEQLK